MLMILIDQLKKIVMKDSYIYPGEFVPTTARDKVAGGRGARIPAKAPTNVFEKECCYEIEVAVPGVKREDITIYCHKNILSIEVPLTINEGEYAKVHLQDFEKGNVLTNVMIPLNADSQFMTAELKQGILQIIIPKTAPHEWTDNERLIVY